MRSGNVRDAAGLLAGVDVLDLEVAAVGDDVDHLDIQNLASRFSGLRQQTHVHDLVGHACSTISLCLGSTATCTLYPTATFVWAAIARLSGSG